MTLPAAVRSFITGHRRLLAVVVGLAVLAGGGSGIAFVLLRSTTLTVLVKDVPSQSRASVLVNGPSGFSKHLTSSRAFAVSPGTYRIEATPESDGSSTVYPTHDSTSVVITSGSSSQVVVDYADIVPAATKVGTAATLKGGTVTLSSITVPSSNAGVSSFAAGDVLAFGPTPETPKGLLVRVTAVATSGGMTTVSVTPAPITAALTRARIDLVAHFDATQATGLAYEPGTSSTALISDELGGPIVTTALSKTASVKLSWNPKLPAYTAPVGQNSPLCSGSTASGVTATVRPTASVDLNVTATISGSWGFFSGPQFSMTISGTETALAEMQASLTGSCSDSITQTLYDLPPVDLQIGPIPVIIVPEVQLEASFKASLHGNVTLGAKQLITLEGGVSYANGKFHLIHSFSSSATLVGTGSASSDLKVQGGPALLMALDDQEAGPNLQVLGDVEAKAPTSDPSAAGIYAGGTAGVGAEVHFFGINAAAGPWGVSWGPIKLWPSPNATSSPTSTPKPSPKATSSPTSAPQPTSSPSSVPSPKATIPLVWSAPTLIDPNGGSSLSCPSSDFCAAVDAEGDITTWNGSSWSTPQSVDAVTALSVSCVSASFCLVTDNAGDVLTWNGAEWSAAQTIDPGAGLGSVSCASNTFCAAIDLSHGDALIWNGASWSTYSNVDPYPDDSSLLASISCATPSFCEVVDGMGYAEAWNGTSWSTPQIIDSGGSDGLSCVSSSFCVAVDTEGDALTWNGSTWSSDQIYTSANNPFFSSTSGLSSVSCVSSRFCIAFDVDGSALIWDGNQWSSPLLVDSNPGPYGMPAASCASSTFCIAFDSSGNVVIAQA